MLGASRILSCTRGDSNVVKSKHGSIEADFEVWKAKFLVRLQALCRGVKEPCGGRCKKEQCRSKGRSDPKDSNLEQSTLKAEEEVGGANLDGWRLGNLWSQLH